MWLYSLKVAQLLRSAACLHTNQSRSHLNHLVHRWILFILNFSTRGFPTICSSAVPIEVLFLQFPRRFHTVLCSPTGQAGADSPQKQNYASLQSNMTSVEYKGQYTNSDHMHRFRQWPFSRVSLCIRGIVRPC